MLWRVLAAFVARFRWSRMTDFGRGLGWLVGSVLRIRRHHVFEAMARANLQPEKALVDRVYAQLGAGVFELLWTAGQPPRRSIDLVQVDGWERVEAALERGRGLVVATAHTGNWDLAGCALAQRIPLTVVTKHLSWRSLDRFWQKMRAERSVDLVDAAGALDHVKKRLQQGGAVAFLIDQAPLRSSGVEGFSFLGARAEHDATFAIMAARYRVPVVFAFALRHPDGRHEVKVREIRIPPTRASRAWVKETVRAAAESLDAFVREHPDQWLWLHRRWKSIEERGPE